MRIRHLRVHVKELASEAKHIRHEERQCSGKEKWRLQNHRKTVVRQAAREYQLAYACLRGIPYQRVEPHIRPERLNDRHRALIGAKKIALRFGADSEHVTAWLVEAVASSG